MSIKNFKNGRIYIAPGFITFYFHENADFTRKRVSIEFEHPRNPHIFVSIKDYSETEPFKYSFSTSTTAAKAYISDCMKQLTL